MKCGYVAATDDDIPATLPDSFDLASFVETTRGEKVEVATLLERGVALDEPEFETLSGILLNTSSLEPNPRSDIVGKLGSLKFASCQLSLSALKRLFTIPWTCSKRESSPREEAKDIWRYRTREPSEFDRRSLGLDCPCIASSGDNTLGLIDGAVGGGKGRWRLGSEAASPGPAKPSC